MYIQRSPINAEFQTTSTSSSIELISHIIYSSDLDFDGHAHGADIVLYFVLNVLLVLGSHHGKMALPQSHY